MTELNTKNLFNEGLHVNFSKNFNIAGWPWNNRNEDTELDFEDENMSRIVTEGLQIDVIKNQASMVHKSIFQGASFISWACDCILLYQELIYEHENSAVFTVQGLRVDCAKISILYLLVSETYSWPWKVILRAQTSIQFNKMSNKLRTLICYQHDNCKYWQLLFY